MRWQDGEITDASTGRCVARRTGWTFAGLMRHFYEPPGDYLVRPQMAELIERHSAAGRVVGVLTNDMHAFHGPESIEGLPP